MNVKFWILDAGNPVTTSSLEEWCSFFDSDVRQVAFNMVGKVRVSTVFLGALAFSSPLFMSRDMLVFETMVFGGKYGMWQEKYTDWEDAENGHIEAVNMVKNGRSKKHGANP